MATIKSVEVLHKKLELSWSQKLEEFEARLKAASVPGTPNLAQLTEDFLSFKSLVTTMFTILRQQVNECCRTVDYMDMRQRQKVLLFNGIVENSEATVESEVLQIMQGRMGLPHITGTSIKRCHRLGVVSEDRVRPVLVHFQDYKVKSEVWKVKARLKGSAITVTEFLTRPRQSVYKRARSVFGMNSAWTLDGVIHIKTSNSTRYKVVTEEELDVVIAKCSPSNSPGSPGSPIVSESPREPSAGTAKAKVATTSTREQDPRRKQHATATHLDDAKRSRRNVPKK